ncbi:MAG: hypothetical protein N2257_10730, partial [Thermodesulfovibrionales bacterium]|nr:hypothetical protein [Thermodesulfovibrionales bacterium]
SPKLRPGKLFKWVSDKRRTKKKPINSRNLIEEEKKSILKALVKSPKGMNRIKTIEPKMTQNESQKA